MKRSLSSGPGLTAVRMHTDCGPIILDRADGSLATLSIEGQPDRAVALKRRDTAELIAEELRRLDPDDTYASALRFGVERLNTSNESHGKGAEVPPRSRPLTRTPARRDRRPKEPKEPKETKEEGPPRSLLPLKRLRKHPRRKRRRRLR
ncbi:Glucose-6-phosphate dehydrogenase assembly protein OpcA OS=Streptomyces alboniger OX=132473 GN=opcA PE=4 SV=1 [Streptomyces alboniger]